MAAHDLLQRGLGSTYMHSPYYAPPDTRSLSYYAAAGKLHKLLISVTLQLSVTGLISS